MTINVPNLGEDILHGIPASEGFAFGPVFCYRPASLSIPGRKTDGADVEFARFERACEKARYELEEIKEGVLNRTQDTHQAEIFEAHLMMLADPMLHETVQKCVQEGQIVEQAVQQATAELASMLASMPDELFASRAIDVQDIGRRLLCILLGLPSTTLGNLQQPVIIVAHDLTPSDTGSLAPELTLGFCTEAGGLTSHTAILARTLGIPAVVGLGAGLLDRFKDGDILALDGSQGILIANPSPATLDRFRKLKQRQERGLAALQSQAGREAQTANGRRVEVGANVGDVDSAFEAVRNGAEGIGLLRTEFLYLNETSPPGEEKQVEIYRQIFAALAGRPVIVRTLDIGGDKPPSYLHFDAELNPFLGWRGVRVCLDERSLFRTQLRAILRAAAGWTVRVMYPMVSGLEELRQANELVAMARVELESEGLDYGRDVPLGIMVETPAAVALSDFLAQECEFFSLGTNDLTQYSLAVDRTNARVAGLFQPLHPAVLRLIKQAIDAAHRHGRWIGMCGELAGMPKAIPILLGLGLDEFSMAPRAIPYAKWLIGQVRDDEAQRLAEKALQLRTAAEIDALAQGFLAEHEMLEPS